MRRMKKVVKSLIKKLDFRVDKNINISKLCNCDLPPVPGHVIDDVSLITMSEHELWGLLSSIKLLEERLTNNDLENRRKIRDELCQRHPELICPVCKKKTITPPVIDAPQVSMPGI